ncbi:hypothetical protein [Anatilimnocola floriformis]|uniref:hypothetical protein n=1 Tax=Anatilimnocola floriformis TaxID=2948575 RepID=UPI0020C246EF|nr:hypothetical protein [Anatilimnocola floriformis]
MNRLVLFVLVALITGCGGPKFVPVSGIIKLNGEPYGKAVITFQPISTESDPNPGRGSSALTDANGRYSLESGTNKGAIIGKHRVRIQTAGGNVVGQDPTQVAEDGAPAVRNVDPIPPEWNSNSAKEFEVPLAGTDKADFDIVTK